MEKAFSLTDLCVEPSSNDYSSTLARRYVCTLAKKNVPSDYIAYRLNWRPTYRRLDAYIVIEIDHEMSHMKDTNSFCIKREADGRTPNRQTDREARRQTSWLTEIWLTKLTGDLAHWLINGWLNKLNTDVSFYNYLNYMTLLSDGWDTKKDRSLTVRT